ncbi:hypothetical protein [Flavobacterium sp.]|uniref:hypothetical protein n=1 Tax=Flavobacterium sp. TaxID=239 RepID=UPI0028BE6043|nr:hypothetical protein [Flavobacterium sp.]
MAIGFAFLPFFVIYLYMINFVLEPLGDSYFIWIMNAFVTSYIGGVSIINYLNNSEEHFFWLLLSSILFLIQIGAFFFNRFYIKNESIYQLVILSYGISQFAFCKFLLLKEQKSSVV